MATAAFTLQLSVRFDLTNRLQQLTGDVDVGQRMTSGQNAGWITPGATKTQTCIWPTSWPNPFYPPWDPPAIVPGVSANPTPWIGYFETVDSAGHQGVPPPNAANATPSITAWHYNVDGGDNHYAFNGWVWADQKKTQTLPGLIWLFGDMTQPLTAASPYYWDAIGWSTDGNSAADAGTFHLHFYCFNRNANPRPYPMTDYDPDSRLPVPFTQPLNTKVNPSDPLYDDFTLLVTPDGTPPDFPFKKGSSLSLRDMGDRNAPFSGISLPNPPETPSGAVTTRPGPGPNNTRSIWKYVILRVATDHGGMAILTYFDEDDTSPTFNRFVYIRTVSNNVPPPQRTPPTPGAHFIQQVVRRATDSSGHEWIYMLGTGTDGGPDYFLARTPAASFGTTNDQTEYLKEVSNGNPTFCRLQSTCLPESDEASCKLFGLLNQAVQESPGFQKLGVRGCSVAKCGLGWLMIYEDEVQQGQIQFRWANSPWGPWISSLPSTIYDTTAGLDPAFGGSDGGSGAGIIHLYPSPKGQTGDGLSGPNTHDRPSTGPDGNQVSYLADYSGRAYFPRIIESWTKYTPVTTVSEGHPPLPGSLSIYFTISTLEPYYMHLMRADFTLTLSPLPSPHPPPGPPP